MKIGKNKVVTLTYTLRVNDAQGEVIQKVDENKPFVHLFGAGSLLPAFEENLTGLETGSEFGFPLLVEEAYGNPSDEAILELDKKIFEIDGVIDESILSVGNMITMENQDGQPVEGRVLAIKEDLVIMDFNHPLAGENLYFSGEVLDVRDASVEESAHGHVHGAGGHHH